MTRSFPTSWPRATIVRNSQHSLCISDFSAETEKDRISVTLVPRYECRNLRFVRTGCVAVSCGAVRYRYEFQCLWFVIQFWRYTNLSVCMYVCICTAPDAACRSMPQNAALYTYAAKSIRAHCTASRRIRNIALLQDARQRAAPHGTATRPVWMNL